MKSVTRKYISCTAAAMAVALAFAGCSAGTAAKSEDKDDGDKPEETTIEESETNTEEPSVPVSQPSKASFDYQIMTVNGTSKDRGYYVVEVEEDGYPYDVIISSGEQSTGGYDIQIMSVDYDGSLLTITVEETAPGPTDMVTEAEDPRGITSSSSGVRTISREMSGCTTNRRFLSSKEWMRREDRSTPTAENSILRLIAALIRGRR